MTVWHRLSDIWIQFWFLTKDPQIEKGKKFLHSSKPEQCSSTFPKFVLTFVCEKNKLQLGPLQSPTVTSYAKHFIVLRDVLIFVLSRTCTHFSLTFGVCCLSDVAVSPLWPPLSFTTAPRVHRGIAAVTATMTRGWN